MQKDSFPKRRRPVHFSPVEMGNRPVVFFLTVCSKDRAAVLANPKMHQALRDAWQEAGHFLVGRYVVMPDHVHLFCSPSLPDASLEQWVGYWKSLVAQRWDGSASLWQRAYWDSQLRSGESYAAKWEYVRENPVRAGLVSRGEEWAYQGELERLFWIE